MQAKATFTPANGAAVLMAEPTRPQPERPAANRHTAKEVRRRVADFIINVRHTLRGAERDSLFPHRSRPVPVNKRHFEWAVFRPANALITGPGPIPTRQNRSQPVMPPTAKSRGRLWLTRPDLHENPAAGEGCGRKGNLHLRLRPPVNPAPRKLLFAAASPACTARGPATIAPA